MTPLMTAVGLTPVLNWTRWSRRHLLMLRLSYSGLSGSPCLGEQHLNKILSINKRSGSVMAMHPISVNARLCYAVVNLASQNGTFNMYKCMLPVYSFHIIFFKTWE